MCRHCSVPQVLNQFLSLYFPNNISMIELLISGICELSGHLP